MIVVPLHDSYRDRLNRITTLSVYVVVGRLKIDGSPRVLSGVYC